jgi:hypothetical protein
MFPRDRQTGCQTNPDDVIRWFLVKFDTDPGLKPELLAASAQSNIQRLQSNRQPGLAAFNQDSLPGSDLRQVGPR